MQTWTRESMLALLNSSDKAVAQGLVVLFNRQTADEQRSDTTSHLNGRGFNGRDAAFGSSLAKQVIAWNSKPIGRRYPTPLSASQIGYGRKLIRKYANQLAIAANEKAAAQAALTPAPVAQPVDVEPEALTMVDVAAMNIEYAGV